MERVRCVRHGITERVRHTSELTNTSTRVNTDRLVRLTEYSGYIIQPIVYPPLSKPSDTELAYAPIATPSEGWSRYIDKR